MQRRTDFFIFLLALYVLLQFAWWAYHIIDLTHSLNEDAGYIQKRILMILGEGAVFFSLVVFAIFQIRKSINRDIELSRQQKNFLLAVTHELKTPIASVKLYLQTLKKRQLEPEKREDIAENALKENDRLQKIIDNILSVSQLENKTFKLFPFNVNIKDSFEQAIRVYRLQEQGTITIHCPENLTLRLDENAWSSILSNLIDNAFKYSGDAPVIQLIAKQDDETVTIEVIDNGVGVPEEKLKLIFDRFVRLGHEETRSAKGVGLGLYIVRELVQAMKGTIKAENVASGGLKFSICFPKRD